jgi:hypothetical protein
MSELTPEVYAVFKKKAQALDLAIELDGRDKIPFEELMVIQGLEFTSESLGNTLGFLLFTIPDKYEFIREVENIQYPSIDEYILDGNPVDKIKMFLKKKSL